MEGNKGNGENSYSDVIDLWSDNIPSNYGFDPEEHYMRAPGQLVRELKRLIQGPYPPPPLPDPRTVAAGLSAYSFRKSPFYYAAPTNPVTLASGATSPMQTITMAGDSYFVCTAILVRSTATAAAPMNTVIDFNDNETAGRINSQPIPLDLLAGWAAPGLQTPVLRAMPVQKVWRPATQIQYNLIDRATGVAQVIDVVFCGYKMYIQGAIGV